MAIIKYSISCIICAISLLLPVRIKKVCLNFTDYCRTIYRILPESPRWLLSKGHYEHAERILRRIASQNQRHFDPDAYERLVVGERKVMVLEVVFNTHFMQFFQRKLSGPHVAHGLWSIFRSKVMIIIGINMSFQW